LPKHIHYRKVSNMRQGLILILIISSILLPAAYAKNVPIPPLDLIINKIDQRWSRWTALKADLTLNFEAEQKDSASCRGELTYNRLDEKLLLHCFSNDDKLLFGFKSDDTEFELYLPTRDIIFTGNIFDLENSPDIESHLKPLDLYRALKPLAVPQKFSSIEGWNKKTVALKVFGRNHFEHYLSRRLVTSQKGDVFKETYYSFDEKPTVTIYRSNFQKYRIADSQYKKKVVYPQRIYIESESIDKRVDLIFDHIQFYSFLEKQDWSLTAPPTTPLINLSEKD